MRERVQTFLEGGPFPSLSQGKIWASVGSVKVAKMDVSRSAGQKSESHVVVGELIDRVLESRSGRGVGFQLLLFLF
jgi:hypothetical protein